MAGGARMPYAVDIAMDHSANGDGDVPRFGLVKAEPHTKSHGRLCMTPGHS